MKENFVPAVNDLFAIEGFKSNLVGDPGGRTIFGISERYYPADVARMASMTREDAEVYAREFYRAKFWDAFGCDELTSPMDEVTFLLAVNPGPGFVRGLGSAQDWKDLLLEAVDYYCDRAAEGQGKTPCCMEGNCKVPQDKCKRRFIIGWEHGRVIGIYKKFKGVKTGP